MGPRDGWELNLEETKGYSEDPDSTDKEQNARANPDLLHQHSQPGPIV